MRILSLVYQIAVRTSATNTCTVTVPEHEIRVLEAIHSLDNVDTDNATLLDEQLAVDVNDEYQRLLTKYQSEDALREAYGNDTKRALASLLAQNSKGEAPEENADIVLDGPDTPIVKKGLPTLPKDADAQAGKGKKKNTAQAISE